MSQNKFTTNNNPTLVAVSNVDGETPVYLYADPSTHGLILAATLAGGPIPATGATSAVNVQIVDGSGNQITSFGGGTQYTDGGTPPTHPIGPTLQFNNGGTWNTVSAANPLPVSATISTAGLATSVKQSDGSQKTQIVDGSGSVIASTSNALNVSLTNSSIAVTGTFFQTTQPVSGTVTANAGTGNFTVVNGGTFAVQAAATLSAETTKVIGVVRNADGSGNLLTSTSNALDVNIKSGSSAGQQYADGTARGTATGTLMMVDDGTNIQSAIGTTAGVLKVDLSATAANTTAIKVDGSAVTQPVSLTSTTITGTVAVTQSTSPWIVGQATAANLNATVVGTGTFATQVTSLPALPSGTNVIGHVITDTGSTTAVTGNVTVVQGTGTNLHTVIDSGTLTAVTAITNALPVGANVIGKVSIDQTTPGTTNLVALAANQSINLTQIAGGTISTTGVTGQQKVGIVDSLGNSTNSAATGFLKVTDEPKQIFYDPFDTTPDTTNMWTSTTGSSGVAASVTTGVLSMGTGTVANGYSKFTSIPTFKPVIPGWLVYSDAILIPDAGSPTANALRLWGAGTTPGTPTFAAPITDGYFFELSGSTLSAVVYAGGVRTQIATGLTLATTYQRYIIQVRTDRTFFYIGTIDSAGLVATTNFQSPQIQTLPKLFLAVGNSTPPGSNSQIQCTGAVVSDTGKNATLIADGTFPWRKAAITSVGELTVTAGVTATSLGKAEDAAASSGDTGVMSLGVRNDTLAAQTNNNGDYGAPAVDQAGVVIVAGAPRALKVNPVPVTITSSTAETTVLTAVASTFLDVYGATFANISSSVCQVTLRDATAGTIRWIGEIPPNDQRGFMIPVDSAIPQAAVNNNWTVTCGASVSSMIVTLFAVKRI